MNVLDQKEELTAPRQEMAPLPPKHKDTALARSMSLMRQTARRSFSISERPSPPPGEEREEYPYCKFCGGTMSFFMRFELHQMEPLTSGLYTFYFCASEPHSDGGISLEVKYDPGPEGHEILIVPIRIGPLVPVAQLGATERFNIPERWRNKKGELSGVMLGEALGHPVEDRDFYWLKIGGPQQIAAIPCDKCKNPLEALATIRPQYWLGLPWRGVIAIYFLVCSCAPSTVHARVERGRRRITER
jgi:hypothetical protein